MGVEVKEFIRLFDWYGLGMLLVVVGAGALVAGVLLRPPPGVDLPTRTRYPGEEAHAIKACKTQGQKVMYWWLSDPRLKSATMHVRCTGVVTVETEVKF